MKKAKSKKVILVIISIIILLFMMYNLFWYLFVYNEYDKYIAGFEEFRPHISYVLNGDDGYLYNVKYPDYLSFTGNLCVATNDGKQALLIWPEVFGTYKFGVQIIDEESEEEYSIMLNNSRKADVLYCKGNMKCPHIITSAITLFATLSAIIA